MITDLTPYRQYVDEFDLSEEQKLELVNTMEMIVERILSQRFLMIPEHSSK
jgi:hypothetical protein